MRTLFSRGRVVTVGGLDGDHAQACARLHALAFPHPWDASEFERLIGASNSYGNVAIEARTGAALGFILSRRAADEAEVLTVTVDPAARRLGIATRLLAANIECLMLVGTRRLFLDVAESNLAARRLYTASGFVEVGRRQGYYRTADGKTATAMTLRKTLG